jgi:hypothetical protein
MVAKNWGDHRVQTYPILRIRAMRISIQMDRSQALSAKTVQIHPLGGFMRSAIQSSFSAEVHRFTGAK